MKKLVTIALAAAMTLTASAAQKQKQQAHGYPISPVPFTAVKVTPGTFWGQRLEASRKVTNSSYHISCQFRLFPTQAVTSL